MIVEQMYFIGNKSLFIISLSGMFAGMVMAYQTYFGFKVISVDSLVGVVTLLSLAKELAPVFTGLIVAGGRISDGGTDWNDESHGADRCPGGDGH